MDSNDGGQFARGSQEQSDRQRQTAAEIARRKVLAAYGNTQQNTGNSATHLKDQAAVRQAGAEDWRRYHSAWQNYYQKYYGEYYAHAAQDYIAKERLKDARKRAEEEEALRTAAGGPSAGGAGVLQPTSGLNAGGAGTLQATSSLNAGGAGASQAAGGLNNSAAPTAANPSAVPEENANVRAKLKQTIQQKTMQDGKKSHRLRRWMPLIAGVTVVLVILFMQYNRLIFAPIFAYMSPGNAPATEIEAIDPMVTQSVSADPRLLIPKLNIDVPIRFGLELSEVMSAMNNGVAHYRIAGASAYPGEVGNTVITGHSAGDIYSSNPYKYIFSGLERLEEGDLIYVNYESVRYTYQVYKKQVVEPTNVAALVVDTDEPILTLVTCTPLGTSRYRLLVFARQIAPSLEEDETSEEPTEPGGPDEPSVSAPEPSTDEALPSNEPSFFEGIWNFLTGK